jgi:hypothetical protein
MATVENPDLHGGKNRGGKDLVFHPSAQEQAKLGRLAHVFESPASRGRIRAEGTVLLWVKTPTHITIIDRTSPDYHFSARIHTMEDGSRSFSFSVNAQNTENPDDKIGDGRHPVLTPAALVRNALGFFDSQNPKNPVRDVTAVWPVDSINGGPSTNFNTYQETLTQLAAKNDGIVTDEIKTQAATLTWTAGVIKKLGFDTVTVGPINVKIDDKEGVWIGSSKKDRTAVTVVFARPEQPTPGTPTSQVKPDTLATLTYGNTLGNRVNGRIESPSELIEFDRNNRSIVPETYEFPGPVRRETFASALVTTFDISGPSVERQTLAFEYIKAKTGHDYHGNLEKFLDAGGWHALSPQEQGLIKNRFDQEEKHQK